MGVFRVNRTENNTTISNYHLKDKNLSLKAKGLLSMMFSLPDDWDYSVRGLQMICKETKDTINGVLNELEKNNYLERKRIYCDGKISDWEYNIYERNDLHPKNQDIENQDIAFYDINKYTKELNTKEYKEINNNKLLFTKKEQKIVKPTLEEVEQYCIERKNNVNAKKFYDYYEANNWKDQSGKPVKSWKQKMIANWEKDKTKKSGMDKFNEVLNNWGD